MMLRKPRRKTSSEARCFLHVFLVLGTIGLGFGSEAAELPGQAAIGDLNLNGRFLFELGAQELEDTEIYLSKREVAYLVIASELDRPLLINPRGNSVQSVGIDSLGYNLPPPALVLAISPQVPGRLSLWREASDPVTGSSSAFTAHRLSMWMIYLVPY